MIPGAMVGMGCGAGVWPGRGVWPGGSVGGVFTGQDGREQHWSRGSNTNVHPG